MQIALGRTSNILLKSNLQDNLGISSLDSHVYEVSRFSVHAQTYRELNFNFFLGGFDTR